MNLFGKKKPRAPRLSESIQQLRDAITVMEKREAHLERQAEAALKTAKTKSKAGDKRGALHYLKKKKMITKEIDRTYGKKANLEMQIMALESAASNREVLSVMNRGKTALQHAVRESDIDKAAEVMDDLNESIALGDEMSEAMAQSIGPVMDEDELEAELAGLDEEMLDEELLETPVVPAVKQPAGVNLDSAPAVPAGPVRVAKPQEESAEAKEARELQELEALMNV